MPRPLPPLLAHRPPPAAGEEVKKERELISMSRSLKKYNLPGREAKELIAYDYEANAKASPSDDVSE